MKECMIEEEFEQEGDGLTVREVLDTAFLETGCSYNEAAGKIGWSRQQMSQKMVNDTLRAVELLQILDAIGIDIQLRVRDSGKVIEIRPKGHGRRLKGVDNHIKFDTAKAFVLSNSFYADGVNEYDENGKAQELYVDTNDRYFFAEYDRDHPELDRLISVPANIAAAFIEKFGTDIEKV